MKLILNKNNISLNNIKFIYRYRYIKLVYDLNNIYMNGIFIRITEFKVYKNKNYMYILLLNNDDINLINKIIIYINNYLKSNISIKNKIIKMKNDYNNNDYNNNFIDLNINNIKKNNKKYILYVYN